MRDLSSCWRIKTESVAFKRVLACAKFEHKFAEDQCRNSGSSVWYLVFRRAPATERAEPAVVNRLATWSATLL
jgi:hypothetical protein